MFKTIASSVPVFLASGTTRTKRAGTWTTPLQHRPGQHPGPQGLLPHPHRRRLLFGGTDPLAAIDEATYGDEYREDYYAWTWGDALFVVIDEFQYTMNLPYSPTAGEGTTIPLPAPSGAGPWVRSSSSGSSRPSKTATPSISSSFPIICSVASPDDSGGRYVRGGGGQRPISNGEARTPTARMASPPPRSGCFGTVPIHQLFVANGVSAYFHGHDHQYVYEKTKDGVVYQEVPSPGWTGAGLAASIPWATTAPSIRSRCSGTTVTC